MDFISSYDYVSNMGIMQCHQNGEREYRMSSNLKWTITAGQTFCELSTDNRPCKKLRFSVLSWIKLDKSSSVLIDHLVRVLVCLLR